jgi:hypothetical protein
MQFVDCPLAGDARVLRNHIKFHVEMPKEAKFSFLGCFEFELRGLEFEPASEHWPDRPAAMQLCGQIKFAVDGGMSSTRASTSTTCWLPSPNLANSFRGCGAAISG